MSELDAARKIINRALSGSSSPRRQSASGASATVAYGTVTFVGDGQTSYTYTAADGTEVTTTPALGEYAVLLDSGETVFVTSELALAVGDRVALVYQDGRWVVVSNQAVQRSIADAQSDAIKRIEQKGNDITQAVNDKLDPFRTDYDAFKATHALTDEDVTKKITTSESTTKEAYEGAISTATQGLVSTSTYESGINGLKASLTEYYTEDTDDDGNGTGTYHYDSEKHARLAATIDGVQSVVGSHETLADGVNALAKSQSESTIKQANDEIKSTIYKIVQDENADAGEDAYVTSSTFQQTAEGLELTVSKAIGGVTIEYATSTSATTVPTSGWSTSSPAWSEGTYVWQRTTVYGTTTGTDGNPTVVSQETTCIQGAKGASGTSGSNGKDGSDGRGIKSVTNEYLISSSGSSCSSSYRKSDWSTTCPSYDSSYPYYWVRQHTVYDDDGDGYSTPTLDQGLTDANGTAASAASDASDAKAVTSKFKFTNDGMQVKTTTNEWATCATYNGKGILSLQSPYEISTPNATLGIKDYGLYYGNNTSISKDATVGLWVTNNSSGFESEPCFNVVFPNGHFRVTKSGAWVNGSSVYLAKDEVAASGWSVARKSSSGFIELWGKVEITVEGNSSGGCATTKTMYFPSGYTFSNATTYVPVASLITAPAHYTNCYLTFSDRSKTSCTLYIWNTHTANVTVSVGIYVAGYQ